MAEVAPATSLPAATPTPAPPLTTSSFYTDFVAPLGSDWMLYGSADHDPVGTIALTPAERYGQGLLFHRAPINTGRFKVSFDFGIGGGTGSDGLAFVLSRNLPYSWVPIEDYDGYRFGTIFLSGYAVEFDTSHDPDVGDPSDNHIALTILGEEEPRHLMIVDGVEALKTGGTFNAEVIFYDGRVLVYLSNFDIGMGRTLVLETTIPDFEPFDGYFGFVGSIAMSDVPGALHDVYLVEFQPNPELHLVNQVSATTLASGPSHTCALRADGTVACWPGNDWGISEVPDGSFVSVESGWYTPAL